MSSLTTPTFKSPYLIFIGDADNTIDAKTGLGIAQWCPQRVAGQLRFADNPLSLGVPDMTLQQAVDAGVKSLVIGVAPVGGVIGPHWVAVLEAAAAAGMDIVSGLHVRLECLPGVETAARQSGASLINVRTPAESLPIGTGIKRSGKRLLMVGTDCSVGKKYSALSLAKAMQARGMDATFRATGQTGIMIAGTGVPIDTVVADFVAGAAEVVSPANHPDHWDVIEGQGSLFNPSYAGVSLGLLHGSQPDAIVVCHEVGREFIASAPQLPTPTLQGCIDLNLRCAQLTNPNVRCVGVSVNTAKLTEADRGDYLATLEAELNLPCIDPIADGCDRIIDRLFTEFQ
jgi:uncharacterized NAD-dependent epimerase/dehydratase family protein